MAQHLRAPDVLSENQMSFQRPQQRLVTAYNSSSWVLWLLQTLLAPALTSVFLHRDKHTHIIKYEEKREGLFLTLHGLLSPGEGPSIFPE